MRKEAWLIKDLIQVFIEVQATQECCDWPLFQQIIE
jgi:hypothetical protein